MEQRTTRSGRWYRFLLRVLLLLSLGVGVFGLVQVRQSFAKVGWVGVEGTVVGHDISMDFFGMHILGAVIESAEGDRYVVGALSSADMGDLVDFYVDRDDPPIDDVGFMTTELAIRGTATPWYWHAMRAVVTLGLSVAGVVFYRRWRKGEVGSLSPG